MIPYFILFFLIIIFAFFGAYSKSNIFLVIISLIFTFFAGFRYNVGVDYPNYVNIFQGEQWYLVREIGFGYMLDLIHYIDGTYQLMFLILAIIMQFFVYKIIRYYSTNVWFSCLIYLCIAPFYLATFNGTRQYIAIAIFIYSLRFIDNKDYKKYFAINLFGIFFFHESLLMIALLFPLIRKELSFKMKFLIFCCLLGLNYIMEVLISYTPYLNYLEEDKNVAISTVTYVFLIVLFPVILFEKKLNDFKHKTVLINLNFFCFLTLLLVFFQTKDVLVQMFMRVNSYFFFIYIVFVPIIIDSIRSNYVRVIAYIGLMMCLIGYFLMTIVVSGEHYALVPFKMNFRLFN